MDAIEILFARRDALTWFYVMAAYLVPLLLYCVTAGLAFLAIARHPDAAGPTIRRGLLVFALPVVGALIVLAQLGRTSSTPAR